MAKLENVDKKIIGNKKTNLGLSGKCSLPPAALLSDPQGIQLPEQSVKVSRIRIPVMASIVARMSHLSLVRQVPGYDILTAGGVGAADGENELLLPGDMQQAKCPAAGRVVGQVGNPREADRVELAAWVRMLRALDA